MKRAATQLFKRQSKNRAFFQNYRTFYFASRPLPPRQERGAKTDPWGNWNVRIPGVARGGWLGLELTNT